MGKSIAAPTVPAEPPSRIIRPANETTTMRAWEDFLAGVDRPPAVRSVVVESWQRSVALGVDAQAHQAPIALQDDAFARLVESHRPLLAAAASTLGEAGDLFAGTGSMMLVTDPQGVVLEVAGDRRTLGLGRDIHLEPGGNWNEGLAGTNGIGTALAAREPVLVHAAEHFCAGIKSWTCAGAPIRDPTDGQVVGLLDISGPKTTFQRHNLALAVVAARQIERAFAEQARADRLRLLEACLERLPRWMEDGVVALDRQGRVLHVSGKARALLERWREQAGPPGRGQARRDLAAEVPADWVQPIRVAGEELGKLLIIPAHGRRRAPALPARSDEHDPGRSSFAAIVGTSPAIVDAVTRARRLAERRVPVLIEGETGVGKELFARAIHGTGPDADGPFVVVNCGAVAKDLLASELFGYVRGAFTGASQEGRPGRFELADGGTLCLDEVGEMPLDLQPYLLRALEEGVIYRVGDHRPRRVSVRLIAMTNRVLRDEVAAGRFRRDLYYRIGVLTLRAPPLRERAGDHDLLVDHFNHLLARRHEVPPCRFTPAALAALRAYAWPGNVRELRNVVEGLLLLGGPAAVMPADLPPELRATASPGEATPDEAAPGQPLRLEDGERRAIEAAVARHGGRNLARAAQGLGISRSTLYRKMERYGIRRE